MPGLDDLRRQLLNALPAWFAASPPNPQGDMGGMLPGQAQTRLSRANAFILPENQYQQAVNSFGQGGEQAMTLSADPSSMDKVLNFLGLTAGPLAKSALSGPTVVARQSSADPTQSRDNPLVPGGLNATSDIQHEAVHALLHGADSKMNTMAVQDLVPADALVSLSRYYNPQEIASEIPARAVAEPQSLGLKSTPEDDPQNAKGKLVASQYADMLEKNGFKLQADKYRNYFGLGGKQGIRDDTQSFQKPNEVF